MKKLFGLISIFVLMIAVMPTQAQTSSQPTGLEILTPDVTVINGVKYIPVSSIDNYLLVNNQKIGWGKEIGEMISQALMSVVNVAEKFSDTNVGKFTIGMVAWKVMGKEVVRILLGFIFLGAITWLFVKVYKNTYVPKKILIERTPNGWFRRTTKKYQVITPETWEGYNAVKVLMLFMYAGAVGITYAIMFAQ